MILLWIGIIIIVYLLFKLLDSTDVPKIYLEGEGEGESVMNGCTGDDDDDDVWIWIEKCTVSPTLIENKDGGIGNSRKLK